MQDEQITLPDVSQLEWLTGTSHKMGQLLDYLYDNSDQSEDVPDYQADFLAPLNLLNVTMDKQIVEELQQHPTWDWITQIEGFDPVLMGKIVGSIRFWPPVQNSINARTGRNRWASSRGALLIYCGLGIVPKKRQPFVQSNYQLKKDIFSQIDLFMQAQNKYYEYFCSEREHQIQIYTEEYRAKNDDRLKIYATRATATLFMSHLWQIVQTKMDSSSSLQTIQTLDAAYNDPWNMVKI